MTTKLTGLHTADGGRYGCLTDGSGNLVVTSTSGTGYPKQITGLKSPDGSTYMTLTNGAGTLV